MSDGRTYTVTFRGVSVSAVQDLIAAYSGANMAVELVGFGLSPGNTSVENIAINVKHLAATVTAGSGGNAATPAPDLPTDAAATFTARINDTTQATTSGAVTYALADGWNEVNGMQVWFPERGRPEAKPSEALIIELAGSPAAGRTVSGWAKFKERF